MIRRSNEKKVGELTNDARASLASLLQLENLITQQWYMRLSSSGNERGWELLTADTHENDSLIRARIAESETPITDLVFGYVGTVNWRGTKALMAHMQYFKQGYEDGLLFGSHLKQDARGAKLEVHGSFLIMGGCKNIWI